MVCVPGDYQTLGVDCEHLAAQIEEDILSRHQYITGATRAGCAHTDGLAHFVRIRLELGCDLRSFTSVWVAYST